MGVPNTTTFTLQNVVDEVNPTTDDLVDCFADAISSKFDSAYSSSVGLLKFRNYGAGPTLITAYMGTAVSKPASACSEFVNVQVWYYGSGYPAIGDTIYTNSGASSTKGAGNWPTGSVSGGAGQSTTTNSSGVVTYIYGCL